MKKELAAAQNPERDATSLEKEDTEQTGRSPRLVKQVLWRRRRRARASAARRSSGRSTVSSRL